MYPFNHHSNVRAWVSILIKAPTLSPGGSPLGGRGGVMTSPAGPLGRRSSCSASLLAALSHRRVCLGKISNVKPLQHPEHGAKGRCDGEDSRKGWERLMGGGETVHWDQQEDGSGQEWKMKRVMKIVNAKNCNKSVANNFILFFSSCGNVWVAWTHANH